MSEPRHSVELWPHRAPAVALVDPDYIAVFCVDHELSRRAFYKLGTDQIEKNNECLKCHTHGMHPLRQMQLASLDCHSELCTVRRGTKRENCCSAAFQGLIAPKMPRKSASCVSGAYGHA